MANRSRQRYWHSGRLKRPSAVKRNAVRMKLSVKWQRTNLTCRTAKQSRLSGILPGWSVTGLPYLNGKPRCRRVYCVNHNGCGKRSGRSPGKICCRSDCSRWSGIWFVTCRKRKPWAVIAQFAYYLAGFPWYEGNILFAFAVATQVLTWCETRTWWRSAETMLLLAMWLPFSGTSYGIAGLLMLAVSHRLYRAEDRMERLALVACLLAVIPALNLATSDAAAVAGLVMTVLTVGLVSCAGKSLPRFWPGDFFPTFYACHLAVLGVLAL